MFRNKKGFTLVELLAVIVILAIILAIAVPTISTLIANQKKAAYAAAVKMVIKGIDYQVLSSSAANAAELETSLYPAAGTTTLTAADFGGNTADYGALTLVTVGSGATTKISLAAAAAGQFKGCTVSNATLANVATSGSGDGVVSGC